MDIESDNANGHDCCTTECCRSICKGSKGITGITEMTRITRITRSREYLGFDLQRGIASMAGFERVGRVDASFPRNLLLESLLYGSLPDVVNELRDCLHLSAFVWN